MHNVNLHRMKRILKEIIIKWYLKFVNSSRSARRGSHLVSIYPLYEVRHVRRNIVIHQDLVRHVRRNIVIHQGLTQYVMYDEI